MAVLEMICSHASFRITPSCIQVLKPGGGIYSREELYTVQLWFAAEIENIHRMYTLNDGTVVMPYWACFLMFSEI